MRALPLCIALLSLSASAQGTRGRPSATTSSIVIVQNGPVRNLDADGAMGTLVADAVDSVTIAVAIRDASGRPLGDVPVRIEVTGSRNIVTPAATSFTDANGLFIANLTTTTAETKTISVVADPGAAEVWLYDRPSVTFRAGPATHFDVALEENGREVTLTARDFFGNLAGAYRATVRAGAAEH
ncbi:MAG TPA: Ig-like domain-containing protein [Myxococcales bacterium]|nr:Ig-like domain-containing protein [Myxococcales bacterium]